MIRLFRVFIPTSVIGLLLTEMLLAVACYLAACFVTNPFSADIYLLYEGGAERIIVVVASILMGVYFNDLYSEFRIKSRTQLVQQFCLVVGMAFLMQALLSYVAVEYVMPRWPMMLGSAFVLVLLPGWRMLYSELIIQLFGRQKILFLGTSELAQTIAKRIAERPEYGFEGIGYLAAEPVGLDTSYYLGSYQGAYAEVREVWNRITPNLVVVGLAERRGQMPVYDLLQLRMEGVRILDAAQVYESVTGRVSVRALRPSHLIFSEELGPNTRMVHLQRLYSFLIALAALLLLSPVLLLVALLVRMTSKGPALYRQRRVGLRGKVFEVYKFRSMYVDAEARTGAVWAKKDDPRITPLGRWLRKLRLDEMPQFFNVLRGEMAIVGPRPERPEFVDQLTEQIPFYGQRHAILPGITGWAQINHKYGDTIEDTISKLEYDLYYLKNLSVSLDTYIIFHTLKVMLLSRGAQ